MFSPIYTITNKLLANIKKIAVLVAELNGKSFPREVLYQFEANAREVSSYASTSIEGNPLPLTEVKQILKTKPENIRRSQQEVLNYNQALVWVNQKLKNKSFGLNLDFILAIQARVTAGLIPPYQTGKLRQEPVFVNDPRKGETIYWPPEANYVPGLINALISFAQKSRGKADPLVLAGIFHKQFVLVHPFMDGNGRTVRLATKALLADMGLNTFNLFSFENYYNQNVSNYFKTVGQFGNYYDIKDKIDFTPWLEYFTDGIIDELVRVKKELEKITMPTPENQLTDYHKKIISFIKEKGFIKDADYAKLTGRARQTRRLDFNKLIDMGVIERKGGGKNTYYRLKSS